MANVHDRSAEMPTQSQLVLSLFSGVGLLDSGFEQAGFCVVRGPEKIVGGDVRTFSAISGRFDGVVGGSPCQDFSRARRTPPTGEGLELLGHFCRVVVEAKPDWFLLENVPGVPDVHIEGYTVQRFSLCPTELGHSQSRLRHFQFGSKRGIVLSVNRRAFTGTRQRCVMASEGLRSDNRRQWSDFCQLQGLPASFELTEFHRAAKYRAVGNGVHIAVANEIGRAVHAATTANEPTTVYNSRLCECGCGRLLNGRKHQKTATASCRKRYELKRKRESPVMHTWS